MVLATVGIVVALVSAVSAVVVLFYNMPMNGTVAEQAELQLYLDGGVYINGTDISWGTLIKGANTKSLDIYNSGNVALTVIAFANAPDDWAMAYSQNSTVVNPSQWLNGTLTLTVPQDVSAGVYYWGFSLSANS